MKEYTLSDKELDKRIEHKKQQMTKVRIGGWVWEKMKLDLEWLETQKVLPRDKRCKFTEGKL